MGLLHKNRKQNKILYYTAVWTLGYINYKQWQVLPLSGYNMHLVVTVSALVYGWEHSHTNNSSLRCLFVFI